MSRAAAEVLHGLLDVLYPPRCQVCGAFQEEVFCAQCRREIHPILPPFCDRCGVPIQAGKLVCASCEEGPAPPFAWSQALGQYTGALRAALHRLKYNGKTALAGPLGQLLANSLDTSQTPLLECARPGEPAFDLVVPVPLHISRLRERGYNQAELIARSLAGRRGWPLDTRGLKRVRRTRSQTALAPGERLQNLRRAFVVPEPARYTGKRVLLVDDVLTTAATASEAAHALREAGAIRICVVAVARGG